MDLNELREKRRTAQKAADDFRVKYDGKPGNLTAAEFESWEKAQKDASEFLKAIKLEELAIEAKAYASQERPMIPLTGDPEGATKSGQGPSRGIPESLKAWARGSAGVRVPEKAPALYKSLKAAEGPDYVTALETYFCTFKGDEPKMSAQAPQAYKTLSEGIDVQGGFSVAPQFMSELIRKLPGFIAIRPNARAFTVASDTVKFPKINYQAGSTADDTNAYIYTSPIRIFWNGENPAATASKANDTALFGQEVITVNTAMVYIDISNDLIEDATFDVLAYVNDMFAEAYGLGEDAVFLTGTGMGQPEGILTAATNGRLSYTPSASTTTFTADSLIALFYGLPRQYRVRADFVMASRTAMVARLLKDAQNRYLWDAMSVGGLTTNGDRDTLLGKDVLIDEFMPVPTGNPGTATATTYAGNAFPVIFGDLSGYFIADRLGMSLQILRETKATQNEIQVVARRRLGGRVVEPWKINVMKIATS
jgi:HK97 family phage major capsid protein